MKRYIISIATAGVVLTSVQTMSFASEELGAKLANPVSSMTSVPIQYNYDQGYPNNGERHYINVQPVVPFELGDGNSLVVRTILNIVADQIDIPAKGDKEAGLGDTLQSFFYVPPATHTEYGEFTIGVGPAITWPTSNNGLGLGQWGMGPTGVVLLQSPVEAGTLTTGVLAGHQWGIGDTEGPLPDLDNTFFQPFVALSTAEGWTFALNIEGGYNWNTDEASLPMNLTVSKLVDVGGQKIQFQVGGRYWLASPDNGPEDFGVRFAATFLFPE